MGFQENQKNADRLPVDDRRLVFVSLHGLCSSWKKIPSISLYTALFVLPLKKRWIYHPTDYSDALGTDFMQFMSQSVGFSEVQSIEFVKLLRWKESQGLVLWIFDFMDKQHNVIPVGNERISSFWYAFNEKLISLYDHVNGQKYKAINLDKAWWQNKDKFMSKYNVKAADVLNEFYCLKVRCDAMREIIYQSNPKSLRPMIAYKDKEQNESLISIKTKSKRKKARNPLCLFTPLSPMMEIFEGDDKFPDFEMC